MLSDKETHTGTGKQNSSETPIKSETQRRRSTHRNSKEGQKLHWTLFVNDSETTAREVLRSGRKRHRTAVSYLNRDYLTNDSVVMEGATHADKYIPMLKAKRHPRDKYTPNDTEPRYIDKELLSKFSPMIPQVNSKRKATPELGCLAAFKELQQVNNNMIDIDRAFVGNVYRVYLPLLYEFCNRDNEVIDQESIQKYVRNQLFLRNMYEPPRGIVENQVQKVRKLFAGITHEITDKTVYLALASVYEYSYPLFSGHGFDLTHNILVSKLTEKISVYKGVYMAQKLPGVSFPYFLSHLPYFLSNNN